MHYCRSKMTQEAFLPFKKGRKKREGRTARTCRRSSELMVPYVQGSGVSAVKVKNGSSVRSSSNMSRTKLHFCTCRM